MRSILATAILFIVFVLSLYFLSDFFTDSSKINTLQKKEIKSPNIYPQRNYFGPVCYKTKLPYSPCRGSSCAMIPPFDEEIFMI
jgi:hypothetical protein